MILANISNNQRVLGGYLSCMHCFNVNRIKSNLFSKMLTFTFLDTQSCA